MKMRAAFVFLIFLLITISACTKPVARPTRIATNLWPGYEPLYWAAHKEYFDPSRIHLVESPSATEVIRAFRSGVVEGAALTIDEVLSLAASGFDPQIILLLDYSKGADAIIAQPSIASMSDLKGKRIGVEDTATGRYILSRALSLNKIKDTEITKVYMEFDKHVQAFKDKLIDAVVTFEPARGKILNLNGRIVFDSSRIPFEITDALVLNKKAARDDPEIIEILSQGWAKAYGDLNNANRPKLLGFIAQREQTLIQLIEQSLSLISFISPEENKGIFNKSAKIRESLKNVVEYMRSSGSIQGSINIDHLFVE